MSWADFVDASDKILANYNSRVSAIYDQIRRQCATEFLPREFLTVPIAIPKGLDGKPTNIEIARHSIKLYQERQRALDLMLI